MYCPKCGQVQSGDVRFCSRCGLSLHEVSLWLSGATELTNLPGATKEISPRRKNIIRAAKVAFFSGLLSPVGFYIGQEAREPQWFAIPFVVFVCSLVWMLYSRLFKEGDGYAPKQLGRSFRAEETNYLPPNPSALELEPHRVTTAEIVPPGSVTEYTTNLLRKRE